MGSNSKIEWCDHTFNPVMGCVKVSDGCKFCYAEEMMDKRYGKAQWGPTAKRVRTSKENWRKPYMWNKEAKELGIRYKVFCASLSDVFEDHVDWVQPRRNLVVMMEQTPYLQWQLLTKRPENVMRLLRETMTIDLDTWFVGMGDRVWIGTSVENQAMADKRIPELLKIPTKVRFLSMEPLLGSVDLRRWLEFAGCDTDLGISNPGVDWVIVGGESGPHARPMHPDWARSVRDQCQAAGVKFFMKQWGEWAPRAHFAITEGTESNRVHRFRFEDGQLMYRYEKKVAGRELDGREWDEMPGAA